MATVTLRLTPRRAHVRTARLVAAAMARRSGVAEELLDEVRLAVGEACGRAVQLHERYGLTEPVVVTLDDDDRFTVVVRDLAPSKPGGDAALHPPDTPGLPDTPGHPGALAAPGQDPDTWLNPAPAVDPAATDVGAPDPAVPDPAAPDPGAPDPGAPGVSGAGQDPAATGGAGGQAGQLPLQHGEERSDEPDAGGPQVGWNGAGRDAMEVPGWHAPLDAGLDLALLAALVEDFAIKTADGVAGTQVRMSWSIERPPGGSGRVGGLPAQSG